MLPGWFLELDSPHVSMESCKHFGWRNREGEAVVLALYTKTYEADWTGRKPYQGGVNLKSVREPYAASQGLLLKGLINVPKNF